MVARFPNHRGWTVRIESGVFGASAWQLNIVGNAWYCQHFEFGQDRQYLREKPCPRSKVKATSGGAPALPGSAIISVAKMF